jgi:hypothetical protein
MRASDLLGAVVTDVDGQIVGRVHDLRSVLAREAIGGAEEVVVATLIVGPPLMGGRLGYSHGDVKGPWILRIVLGSLARHARTVDADDIAELGPPIRLRVRHDDLRHPRAQP